MDARTSLSSLGFRRGLLKSALGRRSVVPVTLVALALANVTPGRAADELVPPIGSLATPTIDPTAAAPTDPTQPAAADSSPAEPVATEPPITVSVSAENGNVDVSVRVVSPENDASDSAQSQVISGGEEPDITTDAASDSHQSGSLGGAGLPGTDTEVAVNIQSDAETGPGGRPNPTEAEEAGNDGDTAPEAEKAAAETSTTGVSDAEVGATTPSESDAQYQASDSQYHSSSQFSSDAWIWSWYLSLDCDGTMTSLSTEMGRQSSLDWSWDWTWEWDCGSPPHPPPIDSIEPTINSEPATTTNRSDADSESTPPADGDVVNDEPELGEPWLWTWTFAFCGTTVSGTLPISAKSELEWTWVWSWTWTCGPESVPTSPAGTSPLDDPSPAPPVGAAVNGPGEATSTATAPVTRWEWITSVELPTRVISPLTFPDLGRDDTDVQLPALDPVILAESTSVLTEIALTPVSATGPAVSHFPVAPPASFNTRTLPSRGIHAFRGSQTRVGTAPVAIGRSLSPGAQARAAEPRLAKASPRTKRRSPKRRFSDTPLSSWPPLSPFQAAGGPGASSGFVPSTSVLGTAALVAVIVLVAPGFGRRVSLARELRPRGTLGSSIDRPG